MRGTRARVAVSTSGDSPAVPARQRGLTRWAGYARGCSQRGAGSASRGRALASTHTERGAGSAAEALPALRLTHRSLPAVSRSAPSARTVELSPRPASPGPGLVRVGVLFVPTHRLFRQLTGRLSRAVDVPSSSCMRPFPWPRLAYLGRPAFLGCCPGTRRRVGGGPDGARVDVGAGHGRARCTLVATLGLDSSGVTVSVPGPGSDRRVAGASAVQVVASTPAGDGDRRERLGTCLGVRVTPPAGVRLPPQLGSTVAGGVGWFTGPAGACTFSAGRGWLARCKDGSRCVPFRRSATAGRPGRKGRDHPAVPPIAGGRRSGGVPSTVRHRPGASAVERRTEGVGPGSYAA